jgi:exosortase
VYRKGNAIAQQIVMNLPASAELNTEQGASSHIIYSPHDVESSSASGLSLLTFSRGVWAEILVILALLLWLYHRVAIKLFADWYQLPDYSYGFFVPLFAVYVLRKELKSFACTVRTPSWAGLILLTIGLLMLITGVLGADLYLSRVSFVLIVAALIWTFAGYRFLARIKWILLLLLLAIPLPALILNQITFPLQLLASKLASAMLSLMNIPVLRDGNVIQLPSMKLEVAEACSGIRSLMSLFTLAIVFGYVQEKEPSKRAFIALASIPIAVAANAFRIFGTGLCVQYWDPDKAQGFFHEFSGWVMFLVSLSCLYSVEKAMHLLWRKPAAVQHAL